jgi:hypothetical protein
MGSSDWEFWAYGSFFINWASGIKNKGKTCPARRDRNKMNLEG